MVGAQESPSRCCRGYRREFPDSGCGQFKQGAGVGVFLVTAGGALHRHEKPPGKTGAGIPVALPLVFVDIDAQTALASQLGIQSIPTTRLYQNGEVVETIRGPEPKSIVRKILEAHVSRPEPPDHVEALKANQWGDIEKALVLLVQTATEQPENPRFPVDLAKLPMREQRYQQVLELLSSLPRELVQQEEI